MEEFSGKDKNCLWNNLVPVAPEVTGQGHPFAPENWPEEGDIWGWRTGRRIVSNGAHFHDRYLYLPKRLAIAAKQKDKEEKVNSGSVSASSSNSSRRHIFASKCAVERYIKANFPDADINAFFNSFHWKIPAIPNGNAMPIAAVPLQQIALEEFDSDSGGAVRCKARNKKCSSLVLEEVKKYSPAMPCDICCDISWFCRDCCCILCDLTVSPDYGGYNYIKCQLNGGEGICGHVVHVECALRCKLAGKVNETIELAGKVRVSIELDAQYYCRRCDGKTDIISHANNLLQTCKTADLDNEIRKYILSLGFRLLRFSERPLAKELMRPIELAISKLRRGTNAKDIWKEDDNLVSPSADQVNDAMEVTINDGPSDVGTGLKSYDSLPPSIKLEIEVDQALEALRKSQEFEYKLAEEILQNQKTYLQNLYQQLNSEKDELAHQNPPGFDISSNAIKERKNQINREVVKFELMKKVANGFGRTPNDIVKTYFGLQMVD